MSEYIVYEYDKKNRNKIKQKLKERHIKIMNLLTTKENYQFEETMIRLTFLLLYLKNFLKF